MVRPDFENLLVQSTAWKHAVLCVPEKAKFQKPMTKLHALLT